MGDRPARKITRRHTDPVQQPLVFRSISNEQFVGWVLANQNNCCGMCSNRFPDRDDVPAILWERKCGDEYQAIVVCAACEEFDNVVREGGLL